MRWIGAAVALLFAGALAAPAWAQTSGDRLQDETISTVNIFCPQLDSGVNAFQDDLLVQCNKFVNNDFGTSEPLAPGDFDAALLQISHDEVPAISSGATHGSLMVIDEISQRMFALRQGATGVMIADLRGTDGSRFAGGSFDPFADDAFAGVADNMAGKLGLFLTGNGGFGDKQSTNNELGYDSISGGVTAGVDYRFTEAIVAGTAFSYNYTENDFNRNGGELEKDAYSTSLYGYWAPGPVWVNSSITYTYGSYDSERNIAFASGTSNPIVRQANGSTDSNEVAYSIGAGADINIGSLTFGPTGRFDVVYLDVDGFSENGAGGLNLSYNTFDLTSITINTGAEAVYAISTSFGVVQPQIRAEWIHEFEDDAENIVARFSADPTRTRITLRTNKPDRNYAEIGAGISAQLQGGFSAFFDYSMLLFHKQSSHLRFNVGGRYAF